MQSKIGSMFLFFCSVFYFSSSSRKNMFNAKNAKVQFLLWSLATGYDQLCQHGVRLPSF